MHIYINPQQKLQHIAQGTHKCTHTHHQHTRTNINCTYYTYTKRHVYNQQRVDSALDTHTAIGTYAHGSNTPWLALYYFFHEQHYARDVKQVLYVQQG